MLSVPIILLVLAFVFLVLAALGKLPDWPWGLVVILLLAVLLLR